MKMGAHVIDGVEIVVSRVGHVQVTKRQKSAVTKWVAGGVVYYSVRRGRSSIVFRALNENADWQALGDETQFKNIGQCFAQSEVGRFLVYDLKLLVR